MKASHPIPVLLAALVALAATGCGGGDVPLAGFKDETVSITRSGGMFVMSLGSCTGISPAVRAKVNGVDVPLTGRGGYTFKGCEGAQFSLFTMPAALETAEPTNAVIQLSDASATVNIELEKLFGPDAFSSRRADLVENDAGSAVPGPALTRGEALTFDIPPAALSAPLEPRVYVASLSSASSWDVVPRREGGVLTLTVPANLPAGGYQLYVTGSASPKVLRCEGGVRSCVAQIGLMSVFNFRLE
jgi:hypothetical protein